MTTETLRAEPELPPSALAEDQAGTARTAGTTGVTALVLGVLILILNAADARIGVEIGNNVGVAAVVIGMALMFFHAARDADPLVRRLYGYVGGLGLPAAGLILTFLPLILSATRPAPEDGSPKPIISLFFPFGWACFLAGLFFLLPFCRLETDPARRRHGLMALGGLGAALALTGLVGGLIVAKFALTYGSVLALLGLAYLCAFINQLGGADLDGYRPAVAVGVIGALAFVVALVRSIFPGDRPYFIPSGLVMMALGLGYVLTALFLISDWSIVVMTRRELMAYFYSPIAYILMFISALGAAFNYNGFVAALVRGQLEPIVLLYYFGSLYFVFMLLFVVPALTMRLIAEEKRTGTYEVLMCAPISETPVVISKLLAALVFYMLIWSIWLIFLLDLRVQSGKVFEYRPLLSFYLAQLVTGAAFLSMGLFFSALTKNQIVAAALTFVVMVFWVALFLIARDLPETMSKSAILMHLSWVQLWLDSLQGRLHLRDMIVQASIAVFFTFLSVKVLEARRWS